MPILGLGFSKSADARTAFALFFVLWMTYGFIGPGGSTINSNVVSRMGLVYAILDNHSVTIDSFAPMTIDKAEFNGHYYLDKAPGVSLMVLPVVGTFLSGLRALHISTAPIISGEFTTSYHITVWLACLITSALFTALAAVALYFLARYCRASRAAALFGSLVFGLATPATGWATTFFSHATSGGCLFIAFVLMVLASADANGLGRRDFAVGLSTGALLGWAVVVEFTGALAALVLVGIGLYRLSLLPASRIKKLLFGAVIGCALATLPLAIYNGIAFGSVFHIGYQNVVGFDGMNKGFFGISRPKLSVLWEISFGQYRGILWICPILIFMPFSYLSAFRHLPLEIALASILVPTAYFLVNSGYQYWDGGYSTGPRHVTPSLPFICLAFAPLWDAGALGMRAILLAAATLSGILSLICASTSMAAPDYFSMPLFQYLIPRFFDGHIHNALFYLGSSDLRSLVALPIVWIAVILFCRPAVKQYPAPPASDRTRSAKS